MILNARLCNRSKSFNKYCGRPLWNTFIGKRCAWSSLISAEPESYISLIAKDVAQPDRVEGPGSHLTIHIWSWSTATVEGSVWGLFQPILSTFPVRGNWRTRRKPTTFDRTLTDSFHKSVMSPQRESNPQSPKSHRHRSLYNISWLNNIV